MQFRKIDKNKMIYFETSSLEFSNLYFCLISSNISFILIGLSAVSSFDLSSAISRFPKNIVLRFCVNNSFEKQGFRSIVVS